MSSPCAPTAAHGSEVDVRPRLLGFLALALMSALLNSSVPTPLYPHYQAALALSDLGLSLIYGGYAGGVLIALFGVGNLAGRVADLRILILPALLAVGGGALLFSLADSFWSLLLGRVLAGIGTGSLTGAANVALLRFGPQDGGKRAALSATLSFTAGLALGPVFSGLALQLDCYPTTLPFLLILGMASCAIAGLVLSWPRGARTTAAAPSGQGGGSLGEGLRATGAGFFLCALALFTAWAVAASLLAIGPKVVSQLLGMRDLGLFGYLVAAYLVFSGLCQLWARRLDARHTLQSGCLALALCVLLFAGAVHGLPGWLAGLGLLVAGYAQGAVFVGSATLINRIAPPASHARLVSLFYVIAYVANWVPALLGWVSDGAGLLAALDLLFVGSTLTSLGLAWALSRHRFEPAA
ncbi:MFS transporter [Aeromonas media]|uniref:MFS transporter n=2 Tax=Aeromonas media TaxID=651 RepID=A0AAP6GB57_AERME|nr:MFS transporter [Aeromonas media]MDX7922190.1 MFS transporter [Aeromonas media]